MPEWFSIEVLSGGASARSWVESYGDPIVRAGLGEGALDWEWHHFDWGSVLEIEFSDEEDFERWRHLAVVEAALDAVPDRVNGLLIHRWRGGSSGARRPRRPRPVTGSGAVAMPVPDEDPEWAGSDDRDATQQVLLAAGSGSLGDGILARAPAAVPAPGAFRQEA